MSDDFKAQEFGLQDFVPDAETDFVSEEMFATKKQTDEWFASVQKEIVDTVHKVVSESVAGKLR
jgi:hypothetical protein